MKKWLVTAAALLLCLAASVAHAQTLPGIGVFSPGLMRVGEKLAAGERVEATAQMDAQDFFYARNLTLLSAMLEGTTFTYAGEGTAQTGSDSLLIERGGETLMEFGLARAQGGAEFRVNEQAFGVNLSGAQQAFLAHDWLNGKAVFNRVPLTEVCEVLEGLQPGDELPGGDVVQTAFSVKRTMSDDGERLTKLNIEGSAARPGEAPWTISGYIRQPGGRSPKDTFAITLYQDEENTLDLAYSALYQSEITRKDKAGEMRVNTTLTAGGKIGGSKVSNRLTVRMTNNWTADGESLREKVSVSATFGRTDNTPGLRMQRLNDMSITAKSSLTLTTAEEGDAAIPMTGNMSLVAVFDGNTFLDVSAKAEASIGGMPGEIVLTGAAPSNWETMEAALSRAAAQMAAKVYPQLTEKTRQSIESGL